MAPRLVIIKILVTQVEAEDALADLKFHTVLATLRVTRIAQANGHGTRQAHLTIELTKQQDVSIGGDVTAIEVGDDFMAFASVETEQTA